jgi:hypothetical protein
MTRQQIETIQKSLEDELASPVNADDSKAVMYKIERLTTYLGTGAQCITQAKRIWMETRKSWLRQHMEAIGKMKPSVAREYVNTGTVDEEILWTRCDRNYSATCKAVEALRSILSLIKTEINAMS